MNHIFQIGMAVMGLSSWIHWASWFTRSLIFLIIADILITICYIVKVPLRDGSGSSSVIGESNVTLVFFFLFTYSITSICFMFLISTFFDKGRKYCFFLSNLNVFFSQQIAQQLVQEQYGFLHIYHMHLFNHVMVQ